MKLLRLAYLTLVVVVSGLNAMEQTPDSSNAGIFAMLDEALLSRIADIANNCDLNAIVDAAKEPVLDWKDINTIQSQCKFLRKYFINHDREIVADFRKERLTTKVDGNDIYTESVETFLDRVFTFLLKANLYPHNNPITLVLSNNGLGENSHALAAFFTKLYSKEGLSEKIIALELDRNNLIELPDEIRFLKNLKYLDLADNSLTGLETNKVCALTNLKSLNLAGNNELSAIPEDIGSLVQLEELCLCATNIAELPDSIRSLNMLSDIDLSWNHLSSEEIDKICMIRSLKSLDIAGNGITKLPNALTTMEKLTSLQVDASQLPMTEIVKICQLTQLEWLELYDYCLPTLPDEIKNLKKLTSLAIGSNTEHIETIEDIVGIDFPKMRGSELTKLCGLQNLHSLAIRCITLSSLPEEIVQLQKLTCLNLVITNLPIPELTKICQLPNLEHLDLTGNLLTGLPDAIGRLHNLKELYLMFNNIPSAELAKLSTLMNLETLAVESNGLTALPAEFAHLHNLKTLDLTGNPIDQNDDYALLLSQLPKDLNIMM